MSCGCSVSNLFPRPLNGPEAHIREFLGWGSIPIRLLDGALRRWRSCDPESSDGSGRSGTASPLTVALRGRRQEAPAAGRRSRRRPKSAKTLAMRAFDRALANVLDIDVPMTEVIDLIHSRYDRAQRWRGFLTALAGYFLLEAA